MSQNCLWFRWKRSASLGNSYRPQIRTQHHPNVGCSHSISMYSYVITRWVPLVVLDHCNNSFSHRRPCQLRWMDWKRSPGQSSIISMHLRSSFTILSSSEEMSIQAIFEMEQRPSLYKPKKKKKMTQTPNSSRFPWIRIQMWNIDITIWRQSIKRLEYYTDNEQDYQ